mgnify:CR=1 FL=1
MANTTAQDYIALWLLSLYLMRPIPYLGPAYQVLDSINSVQMAPIECITLFEIPDETSLNRVLDKYKIMIATATKVNKNSPSFCLNQRLISIFKRTENPIL